MTGTRLPALALPGRETNADYPPLLHQNVRGGGQLGKGRVRLTDQIIMHRGQYAACVFRAQVAHSPTAKRVCGSCFK